MNAIDWDNNVGDDYRYHYRDRNGHQCFTTMIHPEWDGTWAERPDYAPEVSDAN